VGRIRFHGASAVVFYFVICSGFVSLRASFKETSPFGSAALAGLIEMFSQHAVLELQEVAETMLAKPQPGKSARPLLPEKS
jgi:hypothetical protein